jgi:hypothetical protein
MHTLSLHDALPIFPNIKNGWNIPMMDMDPILLAIRAATNGNTMDIESVCPKCEEQGEYEINIVTLLNTLSPGDYDSQPQIGDLKFKFRPISYEKMNKINTAQFEIEVALRNLAKLEDSDPIKMQESSAAMKKVTTLSMGLLAESIECITTPTSEVNEHEFILDYLKNCDHKTYDAIRSMIIKLREGTELKPLPVKCVHCSHEFTQKLVLNMISTSVMIKLGRVKGNKMVDMQLSNYKLVDRGTKMLMKNTGITNYEEAKALLLEHGNVRKATEEYKKQ